MEAIDKSTSLSNSNGTDSTGDLRFAFGKNWQRFLEVVDEDRIQAAVGSVQKLLQEPSLAGRTFLDIGSGSGLFSLAAARLGASVYSFDFDSQSVACTRELKCRYAAEADWEITSGSILDPGFVATLPRSDVVYSWGVLHHTGAMWEAIHQASQLVKPSGQFALSIYNDQGGASRRWRQIKRLYNRAPQFLRVVMAGGFAACHEAKQMLIRLARFQNPLPFADWAKIKQQRGMSAWHDMVDWIGGYPFEVAKPDEIFSFLKERGFQLEYMKTLTNGYGCNEYTFRKTTS